MQGRVKRFDRYGFIVGEDGKEYLYTKRNVTEKGFRPFYQGDYVTFDPYEDSKGLKAVNVRRSDAKCL